jgi:EAL domain-containing protein (putative c-di-GMP-specific phosphodiesterase class I)
MKAWSTHIEAAINGGRLKLDLRPVVDCESGATHHFRASVRVRMTDGTYVPADAFLPLVSRCGLMQSLDRWVLREAMSALCHQPGASLFVPVSDASLGDREHFRHIAQEVGRNSTVSARLGLEIREAAAAANAEALQRWLRRITGHGCRVALADYGTTRSSLALLRELPVHYVTLGRPLTSTVGRDRAVRSLVRSLIATAMAAAKHVIAVDVDDQPARRCLTQLGVRYIQGSSADPPGPEGLVSQTPAARHAA